MYRQKSVVLKKEPYAVKIRFSLVDQYLTSKTVMTNTRALCLHSSTATGFLPVYVVAQTMRVNALMGATPLTIEAHTRPYARNN